MRIFSLIDSRAGALVAIVVGGIVFSIGAGLIYPPAALLVAGVLLVAFGLVIVDVRTGP